MEGAKRSLIKQYFSDDLYIELEKITMLSTDNNRKGTLIKKALKKADVPYSGLGSGTNRMAVLIDGYAVKIALDPDGKIDNCREMLYTKELQPRVIKVYECTTTGLIAVSEFVDIFTMEDFNKYENTMREILKEIVDAGYLIGDCGVTSKNYVNWGIRKDGTICILDFAYIYSTKSNIFTCTCDGMSYLKYDNNYFKLKCPTCGKVYTFGEIRRRITRKQQAVEIGDIRRLGYNINSAYEKVILDAKFEPTREVSSIKKSKKAEFNEMLKRCKEREKLRKQEEKQRYD